MKTTVIHHSADYDGIFCREIARKFLPDAELIGWNFGDPTFALPCKTQGGPQGRIYILDLPCDAPFGENFKNTFPENFESVYGDLIWIDHHKSSIESHPNGIPGYRIDGVAACRLAWQWFNKNRNGYAINVPSTKEPYVERRVTEPLSVRLAGEYDVWDKRHGWTDTFQFGLRVVDPKWALLLEDPPSVESDSEVLDMVNKGEIAQKFSRDQDESLVKYNSFRIKWEGLDFLCLNTGRFNSLTFAAMDKPETGHDGLLGFMWNGKVWTVSLYHANHRKDLDLSMIAVKYGGGGHRGACGFTCKTLPFLC